MGNSFKVTFINSFAWKTALALSLSAVLILTAFAMPPPRPPQIRSLKIGPLKTLALVTDIGSYISDNEGHDWTPFKYPYLPWTVAGNGRKDSFSTAPVDTSKSARDILSWWVPAPGPVASDAHGLRYSCTGEAIFKSTDEGMHWQFVGSVPLPPGVLGPNLCISLVGVGNTLYAGTLHGIYKSTDSGRNWETAAETEVLREAAVDLILADANGTLYVNARRVGKGVSHITYKSTNGGRQWALVNFGTQPASESYAPTVIGIANHIVYASSFAGLITSADNGESWTAMNSGLWRQSDNDSTPWDVVNSVQRAPSGTLYATTLRQIYRLPLNGKTWLPLAGNGLPIFSEQ